MVVWCHSAHLHLDAEMCGPGSKRLGRGNRTRKGHLEVALFRGFVDEGPGDPQLFDRWGGFVLWDDSDHERVRGRGPVISR